MKSIYNIYESILGDIDNNIKKNDTAAEEEYNSFRERLIRIVSKSSHMTDHEESQFRNLFLDLAKKTKAKHFMCPISSGIALCLVAASDKQLDKNIFNGFANNKAEYEFRISMELMSLASRDDIVNSYDSLKRLVKTSGKEVSLKNDIKLMRLGNAVILYTIENRGTVATMYIWIEDTYRLSIRLATNHASNLSRNIF